MHALILLACLVAVCGTCGFAALIRGIVTLFIVLGICLFVAVLCFEYVTHVAR